MTQTILVTGGGGYVGAVLVPKLLAAGHSVRVLDLFLYQQDVLPAHPNLELIRANICDNGAVWRACADVGTVIHLAAVANDPSFELDPSFGRAVNYESFEPLVTLAKRRGVRRFIYASTSSVYGVSDAPEVTEDHPCHPLTDYNLYKAACEPILLANQSLDFNTVILRPATLCGYSPRQRLDLVVNILTNSAVNAGIITVLGGSQQRPNLHVQDMADLYVRLVDEPDELVAGEIFNVSCGNHTVTELAGIVKTVVEGQMPDLIPIPMKVEPSNDLRSYHVSSQKLMRRLGWRPQYDVADAVRDLCRAFSQGKLPDPLTDDRYYNVRTLAAMLVR